MIEVVLSFIISLVSIAGSSLGECPLYSNDMPVCTDCKRVKNLYTCADQISISEVGPEIGVTIFFENVATGKISQIDAESTIDGEVIFELPFAPSTTSDYKVWLAPDDPTNIETPLVVTIEDIEATCFIVHFDRIYDSDNVSVTSLSQIFELA